MASYIQRRRRWWTTVKTLDSTVEMSTSLLGDYLLQHSGLSKIERLLIMTTTKNDTTFDVVAEALLLQHSLRHLDDQHRQDGNRWSSSKRYTAHHADEGPHYDDNHPAALEETYVPPEWGCGPQDHAVPDPDPDSDDYFDLSLIHI